MLVLRGSLDDVLEKIREKRSSPKRECVRIVEMKTAFLQGDHRASEPLLSVLVPLARVWLSFASFHLVQMNLQELD
jgi:hypothetical protein